MNTLEAARQRPQAPLLSIVAPNYGRLDTLPRLLDSIVAQSLQNIEVIVAEGGSGADYGPLLRAYGDRGLDIRVLPPSGGEREFVAQSRFRGLEAARGRAIYFVDADDFLLGTDLLEAHVSLLLEKNLDVVHFKAASVDRQGRVLGDLAWGDIYGQYLEGPAIFSEYTKNLYDGALWCRIFSRPFCLKVASEPVVRRPMVKMGGDDRYFLSFLMFHAQKYGGSLEQGYAYCFDPAKANRRRGDCLPTTYTLGSDLLPYVRKNGAPESDCQRLLDYINNWLVRETDKIWHYLDSSGLGNYEVPEELMLHFAQKYIGYEGMLKALLAYCRLKNFGGGSPALSEEEAARLQQELCCEQKKNQLLREPPSWSLTAPMRRALDFLRGKRCGKCDGNGL